MAEFATGSVYQSQSTGVGPYIVPKREHQSATDAFLKVRGKIKYWDALDEQQKLARQRYLDSKLADIDFTTEGIPPTKAVQDYFVQAKDKTLAAKSIYMKAAEGDLYAPTTRAAHDEATKEAKKMQVVADGMKSANTIWNNWINDVNTKPDMYEHVDLDKIKEDYKRAVPVATGAEGEITWGDFVASLPGPKKETTLSQLWAENLKEVKSEKTTKQEGGAMYEVSEYPAVRPENAINTHTGNEKMQRQAHKELAPKIKSGDITAGGSMYLPDGSYNPDYAYIEGLRIASKNYQREIKSGYLPDLFETYSIQQAQAQRPPQKDFAGWTPYTQAWARLSAKGDKEKEEYKDPAWDLMKILSRDADWGYDDDGNKVYPKAVNIPIGNYPSPVDGKGLPNHIRKIESTTDELGQPIFKVYTTETKDLALREEFKRKGFVQDKKTGQWKNSKLESPTPQELSDIEAAAEQNPIGYKSLSEFQMKQTYAQSQKNPATFLSAFDDVSKELNVHDGANKTATGERIAQQKVFEGWGVSTGKEDIEMNQKKYLTLFASGLVSGNEFAKIPLYEEQRQRYRGWKKSNPDRLPTVKEWEGILGLKSEVASQAKAEQQSAVPKQKIAGF